MSTGAEQPTDATNDLNKPLGQKPKRKKSFVVPVPLVMRSIAGLLGICVAVLAGWILLVDEPFGGEPMVMVSAHANPNAQAKKTTDAAAPAKPDPAAATDSDKPAAKTVTIIDGSTGKRQEVTVGMPGASPAAEKKSELNGGSAAAPVDQRLVDTSRHGPIPKISSDGARPSDVYARPIALKATQGDAPRVAIVVEGLGIGANTTAEALAKLPAPVSFAFLPYGTDLERWVGRARTEGHEVLLQVGMEPFDYPDNDPGPQTLLTSLSADQNIDRLHWFMSRFQGYVGVTTMMGARFTAMVDALRPVLAEVGKRGLIYFDDASAPRSAAGQMSGGNNVAFAKADVVLDAVPTSTEIDNALGRLEATARSRGVAIGAAGALPVTIERIAHWAKSAESRGIVLVPISMAANRTKTGT